MSKHLMRHNSLASSNVDLGISENILVGLATLGGIFATKMVAEAAISLLPGPSEKEQKASMEEIKKIKETGKGDISKVISQTNMTTDMVVGYGIDTVALGLGGYETFMNGNKDVGIPVLSAATVALALDGVSHYKAVSAQNDAIENIEKALKTAGKPALTETQKELIKKVGLSAL